MITFYLYQKSNFQFLRLYKVTELVACFWFKSMSVLTPFLAFGFLGQEIICLVPHKPVGMLNGSGRLKRRTASVL